MNTKFAATLHSWSQMCRKNMFTGESFKIVKCKIPDYTCVDCNYLYLISWNLGTSARDPIEIYKFAPYADCWGYFSESASTAVCLWPAGRSIEAQNEWLCRMIVPSAPSQIGAVSVVIRDENSKGRTSVGMWPNTFNGWTLENSSMHWDAQSNIERCVDTVWCFTYLAQGRQSWSVFVCFSSVRVEQSENNSGISLIMWKHALTGHFIT